jgi:ribosomal RNA-processing protein 17
LEAHVAAVNTLLHESKVAGIVEGEDSEEDVWDGIQDDKTVEAIDYEAEYIDEDRYTTVTVEAIDVSKDGLHKIVNGDETEQDEDNPQAESGGKAAKNTKTTTNKVWPKKTRKKKFRYESKVERKASRAKQKAGNRLKADTRRERV